MVKLAKLKETRRMLLSLQELADKAQVSKATMVQLEAGRTDPRAVRKLAQALGVAPKELAGE